MALDGPRQKAKPPVVISAALPAGLKLSSVEKRQLATFAHSLSRQVVGGRDFTCLIADDRELLRLNSAFLGHKYPTDVLSFPASESDLSTGSGLGEIAISIERAADQAGAFGHSRFDEICILMLHGLLHLTGLDHETDNGEMALAERRWRSEFQLPPNLNRTRSPLPRS